MKRSASVRYPGVTKKMRPSPTLQETYTDGRMATRLPAEVLLDIVHSVDFNTLGAVRFASRTFRSIVQTNADVLAKRRRMELVIDDGTLTLCDGETDVELDCDPSMPFTYVTAMRRVASHVGFHSLTSLYIHDDWHRLPFGSSRFTSVDDVNSFTRQFPRLRRLRLYAPGNPIFDWSAFLRSEGALELPELVAVFDFRTKDVQFFG
ncbi:hypothetical protein AAVH_25130 [Aphelenchoides avenae]|nr:hypothetical protein AAVH_25130 [Aphelenchus avenae]